MNKTLILGGTGFVGRALVAHWSARRAAQGGSQTLRIPSRRPQRAKALAIQPGVELCTADVYDPAQLDRLLAGCDAVVNLVAILHGSPAQFDAAHVQLPNRLAQACQRAGVRRLVHVSALGVTGDPAAAPSHYLRSKSRGEQVLRQAGLDLTVLRPSVIFGEEDRFINVFAALQAVAPLVPLAGASARFQPVWVHDVAATLLHSLDDATTIGQTYELAGPQVLTLAQLVQLAGRWSGHRRPVLPIPEWAGHVQAALMGLAPGEPLMSADNLASMRVPNVASGTLPGLAALGLTATALETVMRPWLAERAAGQWPLLDVLRRSAGR